MLKVFFFLGNKREYLLQEKKEMLQISKIIIPKKNVFE
jgi:hypothetical protein